MVWTSMRQNTTQLSKRCEAPGRQFLWRCYVNIWWNQRTPSPPRRWGQRTTTSHGRGAAAASPSTWSQPPADLSSASPPAWSEMTRGLDSASPVVKAPHLTVQETRWDSNAILLPQGKQIFQDSCSADCFFVVHLLIIHIILCVCVYVRLLTLINRAVI